MRFVDGLRARLQQTFRRSQSEERMHEEFRYHLEMEEARLVRAGVGHDEARRRARATFGGVEHHAEAMRAARRLPVLEDLARDTRHAARSLGRTPGFAIAAVVTIALGIAATTTMFTVLNGVLLRPLPVRDPERLASIQAVTARGATIQSFSLPAYRDYREGSTAVFEGLAAHHLSDITLSTPSGADAALGMDVSTNYFDLLGVAPALGRFFSPSRGEVSGGEAVAVLAHETWETRFGSDSAIVGSVMRINGRPVTVVGVAPAGFHGAMIGARPAVFLPVGTVAQLNAGLDPESRGWSWLQLFGRLRPGVTHANAQATLAVLAARLDANDRDARPDDRAVTGARVGRFSAIPARGEGAVAGFLLLLLVSGALVLIIAAVNVAGMLLARGSARGREMAIRLAVGAGRGRLVRQLLAESLLLSGVGGVLGILLALACSRALVAIQPPFATFFRLDLPLDGRVLAFSVVVSLATGVLLGLTPALQAVRGDLVAGLREGTFGTGRRSRARSAMVVGQLALSLILLVAAGLFTRTLQRALSADHGLDAEGVIVVELNLALNGYDEARGRLFYADLLERTRSTPGVEGAALATVIPLGFSWDQTRMRVPGHEPPPGEPGFAVGYNVVTPGYFATMRIPLLAGRTFSPPELQGKPRAIVINKTFADRFWPGRSPLGARLRFGEDDVEVIGVVPDGKYQDFSEAPRPFAYLPFGAAYASNLWMHARVRGDAAPVIAAIRGHVAAIDPGVPTIAVQSVGAVMESSLFAQRLAAWFVGGFGAVGLFLAGVGLFGLLSFAVAERTREIGMRMALGASRATILRTVLRDGIRLLIVGVGVGLVAALAVTRLLRGFLHGLSPTDPVTFAGIPLLLLMVVLVATWLPARRAAAVDPMRALREG